jgi:hypothetical protein
VALTIYERAGGFSAVRKVVSAFYDKVQQARELIREELVCSERSVEEVKGFGEQRVFTLDGELEQR